MFLINSPCPVGISSMLNPYSDANRSSSSFCFAKTFHP